MASWFARRRQGKRESPQTQSDPEMEEIQQALEAFHEMILAEPDQARMITHLAREFEKDPTLLGRQLGIPVDHPLVIAYMQRIQEQSKALQPPSSGGAIDTALSGPHAVVGAVPPLSSSTPGTPQPAELLTVLGNTLLEHYHMSGQAISLEKAVAYFWEAVKQTAATAPQLPAYLTNLANGLSNVSALRDNLHLLDEAVALQRQALRLLPAGSADRPLYLGNLGATLGNRYKRTESLPDLDEAIERFEQAVNLSPEDSDALPDYLFNLAMTLTDRHDRFGKLSDLEQAITHLRRAVDLPGQTPDSLAACRHQLGYCLYSQFWYTAEEKHLEEAIQLLHQIIDHPLSETDLSGHLSLLSGALVERYRLKGQLVYLDEAIATGKEAVRRASSSPPAVRRAFQYNLGTVLMARYNRPNKQRQNVEGPIESFLNGLPSQQDVEEAIESFEYVIQTAPPGSPESARAYFSLGGAYRSWYTTDKNLAHLDQAIHALNAATRLAPADTVNLRQAQLDLGNALRDRYVLSGQLADLDEAIRFEELATEPPADRRTRIIAFSNLGTYYEDRYNTRLSRPDDLQRARAANEQACQEGMTLTPEIILVTARSWGRRAADRAAWEEAAQAYRYALQVFETFYREQLLQTDRESWAAETGGLHDRAAYTMARAGLLQEALLTLENGRAKTLSESLARDYTDLDHLQQIARETYQRYRATVERLRLFRQREREAPLANSEAGLRSPSLRGVTVEQIRATQSELEEVLTEIRRIPEYATFLREPTFEEIMSAIPAHTVLAYIAVTPRGSLTVMLPAQSDTPEVFFEDRFTQDQLGDLLGEQGWRERLGALQEESAIPKGLLDSQDWPRGEVPVWIDDALQKALPLLGTYLAAPLAHYLSARAARQVILIPTGLLSLLPLHAAVYEVEGEQSCLLEKIDVAYTPSARAVAIAQQEAQRRSTLPLHWLGIGNPTTASAQHPEGTALASLPFARAEVETIQTLLPTPSGTTLYEEEATREALQRAFPQASLVHFAGHGVFNLVDPLDSALMLAHEEQLTLRELLNTEWSKALSHASIVILSACQTAMIDARRIPDEAIGLLSGFLQVGIPAVIGTLWPVSQESAALLMVRFYELSWHGDPAANLPPQPPVSALRLAQQWLRTLTYRDLQAYLQKLPTRDRWRQDKTYIPTDDELDECPYTTPFFWAAFVYYGAFHHTERLEV